MALPPSVRLQLRKGILGIGMPPSFGPSLHVIAKAGLDFYHLIRRIVPYFAYPRMMAWRGINRVLLPRS